MLWVCGAFSLEEEMRTCMSVGVREEEEGLARWGERDCFLSSDSNTTRFLTTYIY